ncbi:MAG: ATP synthase F1 subunit gamma [bacterium]
MATLRDIRRRISSVRSTQQITKAMKMVAAAKLRKAQARLISARPYAYRLGQLLSHVAAKENRSLHPLLAVREPNRICYVVVTADRGLCGSFNANIIRMAKAEIDAHNSLEKTTLVTVGRKGFEHFSRRGFELIERYINLFDQLEFKHAVNISSLIQNLYQSKELDRVFVVYNEFKSAAVQRVIVEQLLPIEPQLPEFDKYQPVDYLHEPSAGKILDEVCPKNLNIQMWRILLESYAAEQGARMVAMDAATDNAQEMIYDLTLYYNKVRQSTITKEISEIVGGAEALRA